MPAYMGIAVEDEVTGRNALPPNWSEWTAVGNIAES